MSGRLRLVFDRTNWKFGKSDINYFVLAISALLVWAARFRESATTDIRTEIQRISGSPVTSPEGPTDIIPGVGSQGAVESQSVEPLNSCGAQKPK